MVIKDGFYFEYMFELLKESLGEVLSIRSVIGMIDILSYDLFLKIFWRYFFLFVEKILMILIIEV